MTFPPPFSQHARQEGAGDEAGAAEVDVEHPLPLVIALVEERAEGERARVVDDDVDVPEPRDRGRREGLDGRGVGHITGERERRPSGCLHLVGHRLQACAVARR